MAAEPGHRDQSPEEFLATHDLPCSHCGYNLRGLTDFKCPECGWPVRVPEVPREDPRIAAEVAKYLRHKNLSCKHCGYNMRGIPGNRCPECGTTYMLVGEHSVSGETLRAQSQSRWPLPKYLPGSSWFTCCAAAGLLLALAAGLRMLFAFAGDQPARGVLLACTCALDMLPLLIGLLWVRYVRRLWRADRQPRGNFEALGAIGLCIVLDCIGLGLVMSLP